MLVERNFDCCYQIEERSLQLFLVASPFLKTSFKKILTFRYVFLIFSWKKVLTYRNIISVYDEKAESIFGTARYQSRDQDVAEVGSVWDNPYIDELVLCRRLRDVGQREVPSYQR